ncbi:c-type cytochrome [Noviherbaspirillum sp. ST9]|uniref:c-type cytochrome n=1 Tax=Noviherbaspirillum sp. ST9 TaxID=3401606 RepID=UPI003B58B274
MTEKQIFSVFWRSAVILFALAASLPAAAADADIAKRVAPCMTCHGKEGRATNDGYYPRIAGKPAGYLFNQLRNFRDGRREQYPLMTYLVQHLSDDYLKEMAEYFASQDLPYPPPQPATASPAVLERGKALAVDGDASRNIPACMACHGKALTGVAPAFPGLLGLPRDYLLGQFGAWREGARRATAPDCMGEVTNRLSLEDINAVSSWLAAQAVPPDAKPAGSLPGKLPIECGSAQP